MIPGAAVAVMPGGRVEVLPYDPPTWRPEPVPAMTAAQSELADEYERQGYTRQHSERMARWRA